MKCAWQQFAAQLLMWCEGSKWISWSATFATIFFFLLQPFIPCSSCMAEWEGWISESGSLNNKRNPTLYSCGTAVDPSLGFPEDTRPNGTWQVCNVLQVICRRVVYLHSMPSGYPLQQPPSQSIQVAAVKQRCVSLLHLRLGGKGHSQTATCDWVRCFSSYCM